MASQDVVVAAMSVADQRLLDSPKMASLYFLKPSRCPAAAGWFSPLSLDSLFTIIITQAWASPFLAGAGPLAEAQIR